MWKEWSKNLEISSCSFVDPNGGTTTLDENYQPVYVPAEPIKLDGVKLALTVSERSARQQLQDSSTFKIVLDDTENARLLNNKYKVTVDTVEYEITGVKKPRLPNSLITVYIKE
ncbi:MAG: hypothetical protein WBA93_23595 [Microcoleaceae cyanobacterium]